MAIAIIASVIIAAYLASLTWLLRREPANVLLALALIASVGVTLRVAGTHNYPAGWHQDEAWRLAASIAANREGRVLTTDGSHLPALLSLVFRGPLAYVVGPNRWASRTYSLVLGALSSLVAFAAARALGLSVVAGLFASLLVAGLPWSIFFSRIDCGGELTFHQLLLISGLAGLVWGQGGWRPAAVAALGLTLLLYDYWAGRSMLALPLVAAVLASGRQRLWCLGVLTLAVGAYLPQFLTTPDAMLYHAGTAPLSTFLLQLRNALYSFVAPVAATGCLTINTMAQHPVPVLVMALLGVLSGWRRGLFLCTGFFIGLMPSVLSELVNPSTHRMLMAYPFVTLAAAASLTWVPARRWTGALALLLGAGLTAHSARLYFSEEFFPPQAARAFDADHTQMVEALPLSFNGRVVATPVLAYLLGPYQMMGGEFSRLGAAQWLPPENQRVRYLFHANFAALRPFFENLFGVERIRAFGDAFWLTLEPADWSWLRRHGWHYTLRCANVELDTHLPVLYFAPGGFEAVTCHAPAVHRWEARWNGPPAQLELHYVGHLTMTLNGNETTYGPSREERLSFRVEPGTTIAISIEADAPDILAALTEITPTHRHVPDWGSFTPRLGDPPLP